MQNCRISKNMYEFFLINSLSYVTCIEKNYTFFSNFYEDEGDCLGQNYPKIKNHF